MLIRTTQHVWIYALYAAFLKSNIGVLGFYKEKLFINTTVEDFIFKGYKHGVLLWIIENYWSLFEKSMPTQITKENGFAVFNQKNDTAYNE